MGKIFKCKDGCCVNEELYVNGVSKHTELIANSVDAAKEKHVPLVNVTKNMVDVVIGSVVHPMTSEHYIVFIKAVTNYGEHIKELKPTDEPKAKFALLDDEKVIEVYEYCNLHGLWKIEIEAI